MFTIGSLLIVLSIFLILYQRISLQKEKVFSNASSLIANSTSGGQINNATVDAQIDVNTEFIDDSYEDDGNEDIVITETDITDSKDEKKTKEYIGYLEIPKISLKYGFVAKDSYYNNVNRNIQIISIADFPDVDKGNFIIAGHSGSSEVSYFALLFKLSVGDVAKVTYKGNVYNYKITSIYKENKDGAVNIKRDVNKTTLTLITCSYKDRKNQTIYIAELTNIEDGGVS